jgi:hypothetical protein
MSDERNAAVEEIRKAIADLPTNRQTAVAECAEKLQALVRGYGADGLMALALVGAFVTAHCEEAG